MSITAKLQVLLLLTGVAVTVYMFFLYKEVRLFEKEIIDIKTQLASLTSKHHQITELQNENATTPNNVCMVNTQAPNLQPASSVQQPVAVVEQMEIPLEADDDVSVTSNEIKDILTNINDDEEDSEDNENNINDNVTIEKDTISVPAPSSEVKVQSLHSSKDLIKCSEQELSSMKYDDIRAYLRQQGYNNKGTKNEYIQRILQMAKDASA